MTRMHLRRFNLHKTNAANEELVISLSYGREVQERKRYTDCSYHSNSLSNKMGNSLLAVRDINHKYIVVERKVRIMATKSANVTARVQPEIKRQAEAVLERIGLPVSVLIDTLYRQIIMTGGVPYSLTVPNLPTRDSMTDEQFNVMMEKGYNQAKTGTGLSVDEAFAKIREDI